MRNEQENGLSRREFLRRSSAAVALGLATTALAGCNLKEVAAERVALPPYIRSGPADRPLVAITVDDTFEVEGARAMERLLEVVREKEAPLTFFPTGGSLDIHRRAGYSDIWRRAVEDGHEIGNHTYTHARLGRLAAREIRDELVRTQDALNEVLGYEYPMNMVRPPGGVGGIGGGDPHVMEVLGEMGYSMVMWSIDSHYTEGHESYLRKLMGNGGAANGSIILTHFATFDVPYYGELIDGLREDKHLEPTTITGLFG